MNLFLDLAIPWLVSECFLEYNSQVFYSRTSASVALDRSFARWIWNALCSLAVYVVLNDLHVLFHIFQVKFLSQIFWFSCLWFLMKQAIQLFRQQNLSNKMRIPECQMKRNNSYQTYTFSSIHFIFL